jgi:tetratricopeptide (TPR) repeat protein
MTSKDKAQRNLSLTRSEFERDPNVKNAIEYARSIKLSGGDAAESYALLSDALERMRSDGGTVETNRRAISYVLSTMAIDKLELGEPAEAAEHAREALELVPSDPVAARSFATACLKLGRPDLVVGIHEWRSVQKSVSPLFDSSSARATFASMLAVAALNLGRWRQAMDAVLESLRHEPDSPNDWVEMVTALAQMAPLSDTAAFCRDLCDAGGTSPIAVEIGLMAALITSSDDAFRGLIGHAGVLEGPMIEKICERAAVRNRPDLGEELSSAHVSSAVV